MLKTLKDRFQDAVEMVVKEGEYDMVVHKQAIVYAQSAYVDC